MAIQIQNIPANDVEQFKLLIGLFEQVFDMKDFKPPGPEHLQHLLQKPDFMAFTASVNGQLVGGMTVYVLHQYYAERPLAYIFDLAVLETFQRQGIGSALIDFLKNYCRELGFEEVFVQADLADGYAIDFYRSTRPSEEEAVRHFYYTL